VWIFQVRPYVLVTNIARHLAIYAVLVALLQTLDRYGRSRARAVEAESRLSQAQLHILRAQLQPHFLFNALNTIAELIHEDAERAEQAVDRLGALLRSTLDAGDRSMVALREEIALARDYLAIQEARFGDRLQVSIDVNQDCLAALVPHLCLQPLIENAVQHGLAPRTAAGHLWITARRDHDHLIITIDDDGVGWRGDVPVERIGLSNTRARLTALYAAGASFRLSKRPSGGASAELILPARRGQIHAGLPPH